MVSAALDGISTMCDLNIIDNGTTFCVVLNDENTTSTSTDMLHEPWPDLLNDLGNTVGGVYFVTLLQVCAVYC